MDDRENVMAISNEQVWDMLSDILLLEGQLSAIAEVAGEHHSLNVEGVRRICTRGAEKLDAIATFLIDPSYGEWR